MSSAGRNILLFPHLLPASGDLVVLTCHLPVVFLQLVDFVPLGAIFLVDVDFVIVGGDGEFCEKEDGPNLQNQLGERVNIKRHAGPFYQTTQTNKPERNRQKLGDP